MNRFIEDRERRTEWFMHDRFGMFIHWGLYSVHGHGDWGHDEELSSKEYQKYFYDWNPVNYNPKQWAKAAKSAGMKYAVLTTKHHEGFCLFDSQYTEYKTTNTACKRDLVREFVDAFRAEGLKVGFYYSLLDWHHPDYTIYGDMYHPDRDNEEYKNREYCFDRYLEYMHNQVRELMTDYGKIDILWFDFSYQDHMGEDWKGRELVEMVRSLQPHIIMNGRLEANGETYGSIMTDEPNIFSGDFAAPEMVIPPYGLRTPSGRKIPWEACFTLSNSWGYTPMDIQRKNAVQIIKKLVECTSKNGNLLVNVSPNSKGEIPKWQLDILEEVGEWMHDNSESIYGCGKAELEKPEWGRYTQKDNKLYAHIMDEDLGVVAFPGIKGKVKKARRLSDGSEILFLTLEEAKAFAECEYIDYQTVKSFSFDMEKTCDNVIEIELIKN